MSSSMITLVTVFLLATCQAAPNSDGDKSVGDGNLPSGSSTGSNNNNGKTDAFQQQHRLHGLDRIWSRLENSGGGSGSTSISSLVKDRYQLPSTLGKTSRFPSSQFSLAAASSASRPPSPPPPGGNLFGRLQNENELDEGAEDEVQDSDSYEDEEEEEDFDNPQDILNDKITHWASRYKNNYLAQRRTPPTTTTTSTTTTTTSTTPAPPQQSYSQWKWQNLGTRQGLDQQFRRHSVASSSTSSTQGRVATGGAGSTSSLYGQQTRSFGGSYGSSGHHTNQFQTAAHNPHHHHRNGQQHHSAGVSSHGGGNQWTSHRAQPQTPATAVSEAVHHARKVQQEGKCRVPQARLVRVQSFYPHPGKTYVPHCTILHQCSDDTGCCKQDTLTCSPKTTQRVELAFYTITLDQSRAPMVERLVFYNHSECECRDKMDEMMPRDGPHLPPPSSSALHQPSINAFKDNEQRSLHHSGQRQQSAIEKLLCRCPSAFTERTLEDGACSCDCFDKEHDCLRLKRGRDFFSLHDKWCVASGRCEVPECSYGPYIHLIGRCPRKQEQSGQTSSWTRYLATQP